MTALPNIGAPATRALERAGYVRLEDLRNVPLATIAELHGVGPKAVRLIEQALRDAAASEPR